MTLLDKLRDDPLALNRAVEFDRPFRVTRTGVEFDAEASAPTEVFYDDDGGITVDDRPHDSSRTDWEALTGYTGQYAYRGPVMHPSEFLGGGLARDVLESIGDTFVVTAVEVLPDGDDPDPFPAGWAILRLRKPTRKPLDVWFRFEHPGDEEATWEANTFRTADGGYRIEHYHNAVGQVSSVEFLTLDEAYAWYEREGFEDFSS